MGFLNSLSIRIPLALVGGTLYGLLTYLICMAICLPSGAGIAIGSLVFLLYFGSRLLLLSSGVDSRYYSNPKKPVSRHVEEKSSFFRASQWIGRFYHFHDIALLILLFMICIVCLILFAMDWSQGKPLGDTFQNLWQPLLPRSLGYDFFGNPERSLREKRTKLNGGRIEASGNNLEQNHGMRCL